jgi:hypothetical protein
MPIPLAPLVGLALGAALAWVAGPELARDDGSVVLVRPLPPGLQPIALSRPFIVVAAFALLVWLPAVGYFLAWHGDWSYLYLVPSRRVPAAVDVALALLAAVAVAGGFWLAAPAVRRRRPGPVVALVVVPAALSVATGLLAASRLAVSGTFAQFHGDFGTEPIVASTLGKGILFMGAVVAAAVAWVVRALLRMAAEA